MNQFANGSDLGESLGTNDGDSQISDILLKKTKGRYNGKHEMLPARREKSGGKSRYHFCCCTQKAGFT